MQGLRERIDKIFCEVMAVKSISNTENERNIEDYIDKYISEIPYWQEHKDRFGKWEIRGDFLKRRVNWALVKGDSPETIIIFHHHDTVDIEDYGKLKDIAFDNLALKKHLQELGISSDAAADVKSDDWIFGRGACDMKAALAVHLAVSEIYAGELSPKVGLLFLSVGDEEVYSQGMRSAVELLADLRDRFKLRYLIAIDSEPFETDLPATKKLSVGTVGKLMPVIVAQGIISHIKEPTKGINAITLLNHVIQKIDLNPELAEFTKSEMTSVPSWLMARDLKQSYDVSTALQAAGYFSVLHLNTSPNEIMAKIIKLARAAVDEFFPEFLQLQEIYGVAHDIAKPQVITYRELREKCAALPGFDAFDVKFREEEAADFRRGVDFQNLTIGNIRKLLEFYGHKEAFIVIALAPPYYPAMNCRNLKDTELDIVKFMELYEAFLLNKYACELQIEEHFMGICDLSYCALEKDVGEYMAVQDSLAVSPELYQLNFKVLAQLNIPGVNLGPRGKDLHKYTERVYAPDLHTTVPEFLLFLLHHYESVLREN